MLAGAEGLVDPSPLRTERCIASGIERREPGDGCVSVSTLGETLENRCPRVGFDDDVTQPDVAGVGATNRRACQCEVGARAARRAREKVERAHVGEESDDRLGHRDLRALRRDAQPGERRDADAATHDDAVLMADDELRVVGDERVHAVLVAEELERALAVAVDERFTDAAHVTARAQAALAGALDRDGGDGVVVAPLLQRGAHGVHHVGRERVDGLGPVQQDARE